MFGVLGGRKWCSSAGRIVRAVLCRKKNSFFFLQKEVTDTRVRDNPYFILNSRRMQQLGAPCQRN